MLPLNNSETETIFISEPEAGQRLDRILAGRYGAVRSRTYFQNLIADHKVLLNGEPVKKREKPQTGDEVEIFFTLTEEIDIVPEPIPLNVIYEDDFLLAVQKPVGMVVHPAVGNWSGTFVNALLYHCKQLHDDPSNVRPGIIHRLDKDTSGVLVAAKSSFVQQRMIELFSERKVEKEYLAICVGNPGTGEINLPIGRHPKDRKKMAVREDGGRPALTHFRTRTFDGSLSIVEVAMLTGRTHQIRVHLSHYGAPILGDAVYGSASANKKYSAGRQLLHAWKIAFTHPMTGRYLQLAADIPADMQLFIDRIEKGKRD